MFLTWRRTRNEEDLDEYKRMKRMVREVNKRVNEEWTLSIADNFNFWKGVNEVRKGESLRPFSFKGRRVNSGE